MGRIRKPGGGRKTKEETERLASIERKKKMMEGFYRKAEELINKNSSEARQCLQTARELEREIMILEKPKDEPKSDKPKAEPEKKDDKDDYVFTEMHYNEFDEFGDLHDGPEEDCPICNLSSETLVLKRRK